MTYKNSDEYFYAIRNDSLKLIYEKNVNLDDLAFKAGMNKETLIKVFNKKDDNLLIYLRIYGILLEW